MPSPPITTHPKHNVKDKNKKNSVKNKKKVVGLSHDDKKSKSSNKPSWWISSISLVFVLVVTLLVADWHSSGHILGSTNQLSLGGGTSRRHRRRMQRNNKKSSSSQDDASMDSIIDDDETRDSTCREYLLNFLNGTTDERDECEGMKNAYTAADCADSNALFPFEKKHHHHHHNNTDDDVMIDDYIEAWQCCSNIFDYYNAHCQRPELASFKLLAIVSVLVLCGLVRSLLKTFQVEWIPDAAACIVVGATVGGIARVAYPSLIQENMSFDNDLFLHILLPPIIFQAALNIDKQAFRRDLFPILGFAIFGTVVSSIIVGFMTFWLSSLGSGTSLPLLDSLLFGSLISSIDPVATLSILSSVGVSQTDTLYTLIFGESLLNDGVAIVLFDTMVTHLGDDAVVDKTLVHEMVVSFIKVTVGSVGIGAVCGFVCTIYFWALRRKHTAVVETALFFCFALLPFYIADGIGASGIIAIMTMGFVADFFVIGGSQSDEGQWMAFMERHNESLRPPDGRTRWYHVYRAFKGTGHLSSRSRHHVGFVAEVIASIMEMSIFAYLGLFLFNDEHFWDFRLNTTAVFGCIVSRAAMVLLFSSVINFFVWLDVERRIGRCIFPQADVVVRRLQSEDEESINSTARVYLDRRTQQILILAGVRGAVSFALVENIPLYDTVRKTGSAFKPELKAMTSSSILFTVFIFGALTYFLVKNERDSSPTHGALARHLLEDEPLDSEGDDDSDRLNDLEFAMSEIGDSNN
mmetsp:Transcript_9520/g.15837  ORF Transcript_9520/g.15837 Transcript_9520/m.15837 type:complete len:749 (+) Transcript_9520:181-2427(+)|eukprot:CAMPEP_0119009814 /NCGR_PEP_ID=MMETSP1176-20130426/4617_1 /TAXON_ID=265551 /ORGANISM="Synedropsis recta cf, Strain CCMP1620" /LENGTH=748 /DNA_ID=CAMNT_0006962393 /DNA_START=393 /DNA_END=2639 /DNA_ORIENTATION=-